MIIRELKLKNFGKFSEKTIKFSEGINVIYGQNEAGKTTVYTAIGALLFGLDKQREDEFVARLGICSIDQDLRSAQFLKTQFYKTMSRRWMKDNAPIIIRSLRIICYHLGLWTALKCIVKASIMSVR